MPGYLMLLFLVALAQALVPHASRPPCGTQELRQALADGAALPDVPVLHAGSTGVDTEHFHLEGHGYTATDAELEQLGDIFEVVWAKEIEDMGYEKPYGSDTGKFLVYLEDMEVGLYGYTYVQRDGVTPYIAINPDMSWTEETTQAAWEVTAAHEFFHAVQFVYDYWEEPWWMEASSTWMEDEVYDDIDDYDYYLDNDQWPDYPEISMTASDGWHEYGEVIWPRYITTFYGGPDVEKTLWEACATKDALPAMVSFFGSQAEFETALVDFEVRNVLDYAGYEEGKDWYPMYSLDLATKGSQLPVTATPTEYFSDYLGVNYWHIKVPENDPKALSIAFTGDALADGTKVKWQVSVVGTDGSTWNVVTENTKDTTTVELPGIGDTWHEAWVLVGILTDDTGVDHDKYDSARNYKETPPKYTFTASLVDAPEDTGTVDTGGTDSGDTDSGDTAVADDTGDTGTGSGEGPRKVAPGEEPAGCGCESGAGVLPGAAAVLMAAVLARWRRLNKTS